jgi:PhnB protein
VEAWSEETSMITLQPYLNFAGDTEEAFRLYRSVFGGEFASLVRFRDMPMEGSDIPEEEQDKIMHVSLPIGDDSVLMASDVLGSFGQEVVRGNASYISIHVTSREEADRIFGALGEGGQVEMPLADQEWGDYYGSLEDRFGVRWMVNAGPDQH